MTDSKSSVKWNQHPLISTVLWILGTDVATPENNEKNSSNSKLNVLTWKDDHGGNIGEFMTQVQSSDSSPRGDTETTLPLSHASTQETTQSFDHNGYGEDLPARVEYGPEHFQSPQWDFFVSITPPQQEVFSSLRQEMDDIHSECKSKT